MMLERLKEQLTRHEGLRLKPYRCTAGKLTVGIGRNLDDVGISKEEAYILLDNDIQRAKDSLFAALPWVKALDEVRLAVLLNMTFNLGIAGLLGFINTLRAVEGRDFKTAAEGMRRSLWASQVKGRAEELARMMETGEYANLRRGQRPS